MEGEEGSGGQRGAWAMGGDGSYRDKGGLWGKTATAACVSVCVFFCSSCACWMFQTFIFPRALEIAVRLLGFTVRGSFLSLGSSVLPRTDQEVQEQIESITSQAASGLVNTF